ncbi:hypothetical protein JB92DRAFT_3149602 [Gautieria morchelliformis]|nr:hypothetical protein JB92DRAFT_3149602 [Gautieria morchelliformis]
MPVGLSALPYITHAQKVYNPPARARTATISREKRRENAQVAESKRSHLWEDLQNHWRSQDALAEELAKKHGKTVKWMKEAILRVGKYGATRRKVSPYNALKHAISLDVNADLPPGEKANTIALNQIAKEHGDWRDIPKEDMAKMIRSVEAKRALVKKGIRAKPLAQMASVRQVHKGIEENLKALGQSCKTSSLCVTVRTSPHHLNEPLFAADAISKDFIEIVLGWDINEFCLKYESFALFRLKGVAMNSNDKAVMTRRRVRGLVTRGLREITGNGTLDMSWKNFEQDIVDEYRVVIDGWPSSVFDPSKLGYRGLEPILHALEEGRCQWRKLCDDEFKKRQAEIAANGGIKKGPRKERSDKGKKRGSYEKKKNGSDDESCSSDED